MKRRYKQGLIILFTLLVWFLLANLIAVKMVIKVDPASDKILFKEKSVFGITKDTRVRKLSVLSHAVFSSRSGASWISIESKEEHFGEGVDLTNNWFKKSELLKKYVDVINNEVLKASDTMTLKISLGTPWLFEKWIFIFFIIIIGTGIAGASYVKKE